MFSLVESVASSQFVFAILFIVTTFFTMRWFVNFINETRKEAIEREAHITNIHNIRDQEHRELLAYIRQESAQREQLLFKQLAETIDQQQHMVDAMQALEQSMRRLEANIAISLDDLWEEIERTKKEEK